MKIEPSGVCTDAEFAVFSLILLAPPTADQVKAFLSDKTRRNDALVKLVGNEDYIDHWTEMG